MPNPNQTLDHGTGARRGGAADLPPRTTPPRKAAVIGSGVMGAQIAAHLANAGVPTLLLDIRPRDVTAAEQSHGLTLDDPRVANRIVAEGLSRALRLRPAAFFSPREVSLVEIGNLEDDLPRLANADWIIEAIVENLEIKRTLFEAIAPHIGEDAVLSTNTSGISIAALAASLPAALGDRFLGTHFFNPPRYLHLLEIIPGPGTSPRTIERISHFAEERLGKGVVVAKDTPAFIANRIGVHAMMNAAHLMLEEGLDIAQVDALTGTLIGRPKSATFRTADVVGLDTLAFVADNLVERLPGDPERTRCEPPAFVREMITRGLLGQKVGKGFYLRTPDRKILMIDPETFEHREQTEVRFPSIGEARRVPVTADRIRALTNADDAGGRYLRRFLTDTARYAALTAGDIAEDLQRIDDAMRWGFGWELGPFELWDTLGVRESAKRLETEKREVPQIVRALLKRGDTTFYGGTGGARTIFHPLAGQGAGEGRPPRGHRAPIEPHPRVIALDRVRASGGVVEVTDVASILDIGEDVLCVEFHGRMNPIGPETIALVHRALDRTEAGARGLVIGNDAEHFSAGANLKALISAIDAGAFEEIERATRGFQEMNRRLRFSQRPVVVACHGYTFGGACEMLLGADRACAAAESYIGLPELGAGVIPAGGGSKEMLERLDESVPRDGEFNLFPLVRRLFQTIGTASVSTSAHEARELGFLRARDRIVMNRRFLLDDARRSVVAMDIEGYAPPRPRTDIRVTGAPALATLRSAMHNLREASRMTEYDRVVGDELAWVLTGGDLTGPAHVSEEYLLGVERRAFMRRVRDPRTRARMEHLLTTGKPLRN